jgi:hypothetical protein
LWHPHDLRNQLISQIASSYESFIMVVAGIVPVLETVTVTVVVVTVVTST